ncbi:cytochrome P450 [Cryobacterium aureum]|uniref:cytochrome P450 n=1 Tax=Cryobacterium aureum TaxID=995037 RepID=UPI000CF47FC5|nr:cytochrome P450 [Cryobacterium aureum]
MSTDLREHNQLAPDNVPVDRVVDFDMFNPPHIDKGMQEAWTSLQSHGEHGLVWTAHNGGHWIATKGHLVKEIFENNKTFSSECPFLPKEAGEQYSFIPVSMDPPEHQPYRKIINDAVGPGTIRRIEPEIRQVAKDLIATIRERGSCDFTKDYAEIFPIEIFLKLLNLPSTDAARLKYIGDQMTRPDGSMTMAEAHDHFFDFLAPFIDERRKSPGDDPISTIVHSTVDGRPLTQDECLRLCGLLLLAGLDTVVNFLSFMMQYLAEHPDDCRYLIENPNSIPTATEELLRRFGLVSDARIVKGTKDIDGVTLKDGDMVAIPSMLYGLDPNVTECPLDVDFTRSKVEHLTFGHGVHRCAGSYLARVEIQTTIRAWLESIPDFEIVPGETVRHASGIVGTVLNLPLQWNNAS